MINYLADTHTADIVLKRTDADGRIERHLYHIVDIQDDRFCVVNVDIDDNVIDGAFLFDDRETLIGAISYEFVVENFKKERASDGGNLFLNELPIEMQAADDEEEDDYGDIDDDIPF